MMFSRHENSLLQKKYLWQACMCVCTYAYIINIKRYVVEVFMDDKRLSHAFILENWPIGPCHQIMALVRSDDDGNIAAATVAQIHVNIFRRFARLQAIFFLSANTLLNHTLFLPSHPPFRELNYSKLKVLS